MTREFQPVPGRPTMDVGHLRVTALMDGIGDIDPIVEAFPGAPPAALLAYKERYPGIYGDGDAWRLPVRAWLIRAAGSLILVDTGVGVEGAPGPDWFGATGKLMEELASEGIRPADINTVVLTHLHDDHLGGGVLAGGAPAFPSARYILQSADIAWMREFAAEEDEGRVAWDALMQPLLGAALVQEVEGTVELATGVQAQLLPGHTPGHQVVRIVSEGRRLLICGDAFTHPAQLSHPDWANVSDESPVIAAASRRRLLAELGSHPGTVLAPTHFAEAFGLVKDGPDHLAGWTSA